MQGAGLSFLPTLFPEFVYSIFSLKKTLFQTGKVKKIQEMICFEQCESFL
jgi:hypothetical protein